MTATSPIADGTEDAILASYPKPPAPTRAELAQLPDHVAPRVPGRCGRPTTPGRDRRRGPTEGAGRGPWTAHLLGVVAPACEGLYETETGRRITRAGTNPTSMSSIGAVISIALSHSMNVKNCQSEQMALRSCVLRRRLGLATVPTAPTASCAYRAVRRPSMNMSPREP